jgi:APA family basic amino acid/polyamine antiporter
VLAWSRLTVIQSGAIAATVAYTAPVFWTICLLTGVTLLVFRARDAKAPADVSAHAPAFRVPLYPPVPAVFIASCALMLWLSIDYLRKPVYGPKFGLMAFVGLAVMAAGVPLYFLARRR